MTVTPARRLRVATRTSPLALFQADLVLSGLGDGGAELVPTSTEGDRRIDVPLERIGGKGVFVKEIQAAVLDGRADVAVHSAKDLPAEGPAGLTIAAYLPRADPRDALVGSTLDDLAEGAVVGTGSARRRAQLLDLRPDLDVVGLRGNIATRLGRVGELAAVVVAAAALDRLELSSDADELLEPMLFCPQVGQGAIAVECRSDDEEALERLRPLDDAATRRCVEAERSFLAELGGDCSLPAGAHARLDGSALAIVGVLEGPDGRLRRGTASGAAGDVLGAALARELRDSAGP